MRGQGFCAALVFLWAGCFAWSDVVVCPLAELEGLVGRFDAPDVVAVDVGVTFSEIHSVRIACWGSISPGLGRGDGVERPVFPYYHIPGRVVFALNPPAPGSCGAVIGPHSNGFLVEEAFECTPGADLGFLLDGQAELTCYLTWDAVIGGVTLVQPAAAIYGADLIIEGVVSSDLPVLNEVERPYLLAGSVYAISWTDGQGAGECEGDYQIDYSIDGGANWLAITEAPVSGGCSYEWVVPAADSCECLIRVRDADYPARSDATDTLFCIYQCQGPVAGDLDGSCYVDLNDFAVLAAGWEEGLLGLEDLAGWVASWLGCGNPFDPMCGQGF